MNAVFKSSLGTTARRTMVLAVCVALAALGFIALPLNKAKAAAPTGFTAQTFSDADHNGTVDTMTVVINGAEALTTCTVDAGELGTDWTYTANGLTGSSIASATCDLPTATITFVIAGAPAMTTGVATAPTIAYDNDDTDNSIANASGNLGAVTAQNVGDTANPVVSTVTVNKTASRNTLTVVYSEAVTLTCAAGASTSSCADLTTAGTLAGFGTFATAGDVTVPTTKNTVAGSGTTTIIITLADQSGGYLNNTSTTGPSGVFTPVASAAVVDGGALQVSAVTTPTTTVTSAWTLTQPTISSVTLSDPDYDGRVSVATVVFSAAVRDANITNGDALLGGATHTGTFATGTANDATTVFTLTADTLDYDTSATAAQFTYGAATTNITSVFGALLNTATDGTIVAADVVEADGADPVIVTTSPSNLATGIGQGTSIAVTFSEPMNGPGTACTFTTSPNPTGFGAITSAANWSNSDKTVTLYHPSSSYDRNTEVTITIGGCTAAAGSPTALHANAAVANPWTFTTAAGGTSGGNRGGGTVTSTPATLMISVPNGGTTYTNGAQIGVSWASSNGAFTGYKVSYSSDNGNNWTLLNTVSGNGYTWTVPTASTTQGLIKVEGIDSAGTVLVSDVSDSAFTVAGTTVAPAPVAPPVNTVVPAVDPTVHGSYTAAEAKANNPSIADDKALTPVASANCTAGSLIKGSMPAVYYCGADGKRYVFVNDKAYFSWYADFSGVQTVSDATLASITIGGNITYRPGSRMIKIQSDPKVYAVARGGVLRWVSTEAAAVRLFGINWNTMIDDVADSFFVNYTLGTPIAE